MAVEKLGDREWSKRRGINGWKEGGREIGREIGREGGKKAEQETTHSAAAMASSSNFLRAATSCGKIKWSRM